MGFPSFSIWRAPFESSIHKVSTLYFVSLLFLESFLSFTMYRPSLFIFLSFSYISLVLFTSLAHTFCLSLSLFNPPAMPRTYMPTESLIFIHLSFVGSRIGAEHTILIHNNIIMIIINKCARNYRHYGRAFW